MMSLDGWLMLRCVAYLFNFPVSYAESNNSINSLRVYLLALGLRAERTSLKIPWNVPIRGRVEQAALQMPEDQSVSRYYAGESIDAISSRVDARKGRRIGRRRLSAD